jgi:hypothetical protein
LLNQSHLAARSRVLLRDARAFNILAGTFEHRRPRDFGWEPNGMTAQTTPFVIGNPATHRGLAQRIVSAYRAIFSVEEIAADISLKWLSGALLLGFLVTFSAWLYTPMTTAKAVSEGSYLCWPFFQSCSSLIFLSTLPEGYSQTTVYMALFAVSLGAVYAIYLEEWTWVHFGIFFLIVVKLFFTLANYEFRGNFDYYHNLFCLIFLVCAHKRFFSQLAIVSCYFLSTATKIHPSWILGEYFTSLKTGLPIFPWGTELLMTNLVIAMEMIGAWFLFSRNRIIQRLVFSFFVIFHLYSGILVGYRYPTTVLPPLMILFGPWFEPHSSAPLDRRSVPGWMIMCGLVCLQLIPHLISGDEKLTMEGNFYGLYMFEANHQCFGEISRDNVVIERFSESNARARCDPYATWFRAKNRNCSDAAHKYRMVFNHSINGNPFRQIVNEPDLCSLQYRPFSHNEWIKDETTAPAVGLPVQNTYQ